MPDCSLTDGTQGKFKAWREVQLELRYLVLTFKW